MPLNAAAEMAVSCRLCASTSVVCVLPDARDHFSGDPFQIFSCGLCGCYFTCPVPTALDDYYPKRYRRYSSVSAMVIQWLYRFRVRRWMRRFSKPGEVLEIGCGSGVMVNEWRKNGWNVLGIERTEEIAAYAQKRYNLDVISTGIEFLPAEKCFDAIVLFQVLEHLPNPTVVLSACAKRLKPKGAIFLGIPNLDSWQARFGGALWLHLDPPRHLFHFTPQSIERLLSDTGFQIEQIQFESLEHDPYGWVQTILNRMLGYYNILTRYLMGMEHFSFPVLLSMGLGSVMILPSLLLSFLSWAFKKGSIMQVVARPKS